MDLVDVMMRECPHHSCPNGTSKGRESEMEEGVYVSILVFPYALLQLLTPFQNFSAQGALSRTIVVLSKYITPSDLALEPEKSPVEV